MIGKNTNGILAALIIFLIGDAFGQSNTNAGAGISSFVVTRPQSLAVEFWTPDRMKAAQAPNVSLPTGNAPTFRSLPVADGPAITVDALSPDSSSRVSRAVNAYGRQAATTGRVFWACSANILYSCSATVIPATSSDLIVTAAQCVYDTTTKNWLINCNWVFVPGYSNGVAPYGIWAARQAVVSLAWTQSNRDYKYDVAFVALSTVSGRHISQVTGSQSLGFNYPRSQPTYVFGYSLNLGNGQTLQSCSGTPAASPYILNNYKGQILRSCLLSSGSGGGPWLQQFNTATGVGVVYSVTSFFVTSIAYNINGPVFDSNANALWAYIQAR